MDGETCTLIAGTPRCSQGRASVVFPVASDLESQVPPFHIEKQAEKNPFKAKPRPEAALLCLTV